MRNLPEIFGRHTADRDDDEENRPYEEVHFSWSPEEAASKTVEDEQKEAFRRFCDKNRDKLRHIGHLVEQSTRMAEPRWTFLIDWTKPEALTETDVIGSKKYTRFRAIRHTYISHLTFFWEAYISIEDPLTRPDPVHP